MLSYSKHNTFRPKGCHMKIIKTIKETCPPDGLVLFDIETTGLSARTAQVYLIGIMRKEENSGLLTQLCCEAPDEEKELLETFISMLSPDETLVHYNGCGFDIPFLNARFRKYAVNCFIDPDKTRDLYKDLLHYKKYLPCDNLKLKTVEGTSGFNRTDTYDGAELIKLYASFLGRLRLASITKKHEDIEEADSLMQKILQHNSDDLEGLNSVFAKTRIKDALSGILLPDAEYDPFTLTLTYPSPLFPAETEFNLPYFSLNNGKNACELIVPITEGELKYFFSDYKNYTYVIDTDMCMHNSVVSGIAKDNRKKCTRETAYIKKTGRFIPIPQTMIDTFSEKGIKVFKKSYEDKMFYIEEPTDPAILGQYAVKLLEGL